LNSVVFAEIASVAGALVTAVRGTGSSDPG
jgi:hypothetical protein